MRVYLDNCCYNRPFDDQGQLRVRLETEAKLKVQSDMREGMVEYVWSDMLTAEVLSSPFRRNTERILPWREGATVFVSITDDIEAHAGQLMEDGIKIEDAIHLACAYAANSDYFLTVDKGILKKIHEIGSMKVLSPIDYISEVEE